MGYALQEGGRRKSTDERSKSITLAHLVMPCKKEETKVNRRTKEAQRPNLFGLCRVATEEGEANAAWGGQWDAKEIMIAMGAHATTDNLNSCPDFTVAFATKQTMVAADFVGIVSAKNDADKMAKAGWKCEKSENVNAPVFTDFPMTLECRIKEKIDESEEGYYIVAEIVNILVDENYTAYHLQGIIVSIRVKSSKITCQ